ncbi:MAG: hypothetical protein AVDCRST_MAG89-1568, partial [uncultured Gemmatimonadetes bacterium]
VRPPGAGAPGQGAAGPAVGGHRPVLRAHRPGAGPAVRRDRVGQPRPVLDSRRHPGRAGAGADRGPALHHPGPPFRRGRRARSTGGRGGAGGAPPPRRGRVGGRGPAAGRRGAVPRGRHGAVPGPAAAHGSRGRRALRPGQDPRRLPHGGPAPRAFAAPVGVPARLRAGRFRRALAGRGRVRAPARRRRRGGCPWV